MGLLNIDSQEGRFIGKLCMNLLDSRKIYHEWRSGTGAKVDHQRNRLGSYTQQMFGVSRLWIIKFWIRTGTVQLGCLIQILELSFNHCGYLFPSPHKLIQIIWI